MIAEHDRLALAPGVRLARDGVHDAVRATTIDVNAVGRVVLECATPAHAADVLAARFDVARERALADVLAFCGQSNASLVVNVTPRMRGVVMPGRWIAALPAALLAGTAPRVPAARRHVDTSSAWKVVSTALRALAPATTAYGLCAFLVTVIVVAPFGAGFAVAASAGVATCASVVVHEVGHLACLARVPACVVVRGLRIAVFHRAVSARRTTVVTAAGPVAGTAVAALLVAALIAQPTAELATAAGVLATNALGLTVLTRDGRALCGLR